jgi:N-acetylneuraminate synthase
MRVRIDHAEVGQDLPCYIVAEIGQNHNGDVATALKMIWTAIDSGANAVKFQKRTLEIAVPVAQRSVMRDTPWGQMDYMTYRRRLEFETREFDAIASFCARENITWFASAWDTPSLEFLKQYDLPAYKIPSACLTDDSLLVAAAKTGKPVILSTGMSSDAEIIRAYNILLMASPGMPLVILWCKSAYPCPPEALNLKAILTFHEAFGHEAVVGYSSHAVGIWDKFAAAVLGAAVIEAHFTLDRSAWGTDQSASLEPAGLARLTRYIRRWEEAKGNGIIAMHESEYGPMRKLRIIAGQSHHIWKEKQS